MLFLLLSYKHKTIERSRAIYEVDYTYDKLSSSMQANQEIDANNDNYVLALTGDRYVDGVQIETYLTRSPKQIAIVFSAQEISFRYCTIIFRNTPTSATVSYALLAKVATLHYSTILFNTTSEGPKALTIIPKVVSVTNSSGVFLNESTIGGKLTIPPCTRCVLSNQSLADNCFDCPFGSKKNGLKCDCQYSGSTLNPNVGRCENIYTDIISSGATYYFAVCQSNKQITINANRALTALEMHVFKDDSCGITNVLIDGMLNLTGYAPYVSGLVRYATKNMQYVFSSLELRTYFENTHSSMICNEVTAAVTFTGITLNGKLNITASKFSGSAIGGVLSRASNGQPVTFKAIRLFGFVVFAAYESNIGLVIGSSANTTITVSDLFITRAASINMTTTPVSSSGYDYSNVEFPCKNSVDDENLKDTLKLQLYMNEYTFYGADSQFIFYIDNCGGVIGTLAGGVMSISNSVVNINANSSLKNISYYSYTGMLVGSAEQEASLTLNKVYCNGTLSAYRWLGVIGRLFDSELSATIAANIDGEGDEYGGVIGETYSSNITSFYLAINEDLKHYCYENAIFGRAMNSNITMNKAFGYFWSSYDNQHRVYATDVSNLVINGVTYYSGGVDTVAGMLVNECSG